MPVLSTLTLGGSKVSRVSGLSAVQLLGVHDPTSGSLGRIRRVPRKLKDRSPRFLGVPRGDLGVLEGSPRPSPVHVRKGRFEHLPWEIGGPEEVGKHPPLTVGRVVGLDGEPITPFIQERLVVPANDRLHNTRGGAPPRVGKPRRTGGRVHHTKDGRPGRRAHKVRAPRVRI